jgi:hypothetical protein
MSEPRLEPTALKKVTAIFREDGAIEYAVTYAHTTEPANPGTKRRISTASRMAAAGLEAALEGLRSRPGAWGGFGTDMRVSTDMIIVERS